MATAYDLELQQADVGTVFFYGDMDTELIVYKQPTGCIEPGKYLVYKMKKCLMEPNKRVTKYTGGYKVVCKEWLHK
jgi:hypothetical protein